MKLLYAPTEDILGATATDEQPVLLYGRTNDENVGSVGAAIKEELLRRKLSPANRAWDLLSIALSVIAADHSSTRNLSPDGWTRQFNLKIAVTEPGFWSSQKDLIERQLRFLTTDIWNFEFIKGGFVPSKEEKPERPKDNSILLLSCGLDSLIGGLDIVSKKVRPYPESQIVLRDAPKQEMLAYQNHK